MSSDPAARSSPDGSAPRAVRLAEASLLGLAAAFFLAAIAPWRVLDPDMFHEMAAFRDAVQRGSVPKVDVFAFTPTVVPLVHHELGTGAVFYAFFTALGPPGMMLLRFAMVAAILVCVARCARRGGASWTTFAALALLAVRLTNFGFGTVRAQVFTFFFVALELRMLLPPAAPTASRPAPNAMFLLPWLLWLNLHGGFVAGGGIFAALWLEALLRERRWSWRWFGVGVAMALAVCLNPYGLDLPRYLLRALSLPRAGIPEWLPLWKFPTMYTAPYAASLLIAAYAAVRGGLARAHGLLALLALAVEAALHFRHLTLYGLAWICIVPAWVERTELARAMEWVVARAPRVATAAAAAGAIFYAARVVELRAWQIQVPASRQDVITGYPVVYPIQAADWLAQRGFTGNVMTPFRAGAYVSWRLAPRVKVSLDGRYDVAYQPGVFERVEDFYRAAPSWRETLGLYPADLVLARVTDAVVPHLQREAGWHPVYDDGAFVLLEPGPRR